MSATVTPSFANADPAANPTSLVDLVTYLNTLFQTVNVDGGPFTPYVISSTTPVVGDQDKVWYKTDGNGRPLGNYKFYNGNWRKIYSGNPTEFKFFGGDPSTQFDGTGLGTVGGDWDGWAICNGQNGTPNLSNLFIIGGAMDNVGITGYAAGHWNTSTAGGSTQTGGSSTYAIKNTDLPNMKINVTGHKYSAGAATGIKHTLVDGDWAGGVNVDLDPIANFGSDPSGTPPVPQTTVPTLPPFYTLCYTRFVGYA